jgi:hypothetical protein
MPRLYYPYILSLTNFFARLELDYELVHHDLATISDPDLSETELEGYFKQYEKHGLCFIYQAKGSTWCQFDTPVAMRMKFATTADWESPTPPEPAYTDWLKGLHGDDWKLYHMTEYKESISEKRAEAGRKGGKASGEARKQIQANGSNGQQTKPDEVVDDDGVAVGVGVVVEEGVDVEDIHPSYGNGIIASYGSVRQEMDSNDSSLVKDKSNDKDKNPAAWYESYTARDWTHAFRYILVENPKFEPAKLVGKWESRWEEDFTELMSELEPIEVANLVAVSQTAKCREFSFTTKSLLKNKTLYDIVEAHRKRGKMLGAIRADFKKNLDRIVAASLQPEATVLDETSTFSLTDDEYELE